MFEKIFWIHFFYFIVYSLSLQTITSCANNKRLHNFLSTEWFHRTLLNGLIRWTKNCQQVRDKFVQNPREGTTELIWLVLSHLACFKGVHVGSYLFNLQSF